MAPDWCRPLLNKMSEVNQAISMPLGHGRLAISLRRQLGIQLRTRRYDQAYILPNSFKSALVPFLLKFLYVQGGAVRCVIGC